MSRGRGRVYRPKVNGKESGVWWLDYTLHGERHRESSGTTTKKEAHDLLDQRRGDRKSGKLVGNPAGVTLGALRDLVERQYKLDGRRSLDRVTLAFDHLVRIIGAETPAMQIDADVFAERRLADGAARSTINYELAGLRRGFRLAVKKHLLTVMPVFDLPKVHNERKGFFTDGDFAALLLELPAELRPVMRFARLTGWRIPSEVLRLTWECVEWEGQVIQLWPGTTKSGEGRCFPFGGYVELKALLEAQWAARDGLFVFHRAGQRILDYRAAWAGACKRAGLVGRIPHDLRRTAARDFYRAGVGVQDIMSLCGWETDSMFTRYNITNQTDLADAVAKRSNGKVAAKSDGAPVAPGGLS